jgi:small subunit ribosomal protein S9
MESKESVIAATGKRKTSVARVLLRVGAGACLVNKRPFDNYFPTELLRRRIEKPLHLTQTQGKFDFQVSLCGGGISSQAEALRHGIARAICQYDPELRPLLRKAGLLTRDSRIKERKKYGQPGARKRFQYSKR